MPLRSGRVSPLLLATALARPQSVPLPPEFAELLVESFVLRNEMQHATYNMRGCHICANRHRDRAHIGNGTARIDKGHP